MNIYSLIRTRCRSR